MSSPTDVTAGLQEAGRELAAAMSGKQAESPSPATPPPEAPPAAAPPAPEPPPASPAPTPSAEPGAPGPSVEPAAPTVNDPAAQAFLDRFGGDWNKALAKALEYDGRLAALYKQDPERFRGVLGGKDTPSEPLSIEPQPVDPQQVQHETNSRVFATPQLKGLIEAWTENAKRATNEIQPDVSRLEGEISYLTQKMNDADFAPDDVRKADIRAEILARRQELGIARQELSNLSFQNERLDAQFRQARAQVEAQVIGEFEAQAEEETLRLYEQQWETEAYSDLATRWPQAVQRVIQEKNISADLAEDFRLGAKQAAQAAMADPNFTIDDPYMFVTNFGKSYAERMDRIHRAQAQQYGQLAQRRALTPSPVSPPGSAVPTTPDQHTVESGIAESARLVKQFMRR